MLNSTKSDFDLENLFECLSNLLNRFNFCAKGPMKGTFRILEEMRKLSTATIERLLNFSLADPKNFILASLISSALGLDNQVIIKNLEKLFSLVVTCVFGAKDNSLLESFLRVEKLIGKEELEKLVPHIQKALLRNPEGILYLLSSWTPSVNFDLFYSQLYESINGNLSQIII